eukprot:5487740-Prymnesium_polylepis.1
MDSYTAVDRGRVAIESPSRGMAAPPRARMVPPTSVTTRSVPRKGLVEVSQALSRVWLLGASQRNLAITNDKRSPCPPRPSPRRES